MDRTDHRADWNGGIFSFGSYGRNAEADGYFGVIVLGVVTAVGGGMMRDVFLGQIPGPLLNRFM